MKCSQCENEAAVYCEHKKEIQCKTHCTDCNYEKKFAACPHASIIITQSALSTPDGTILLQKEDLNENHIQAFRKAALKFKEAMDSAEVMESLEKEASTDHLTQTLSRGRIEKTLEKTKSGSVVMIDLDDFKKFNDKNGHLKGDEKLREVAEKIKESLRKTDFMGRFGGDEFLVIMPETSQVEAEKIIARIKEKTLSKTNSSITYGVSEINNDSMQALKRADDELIKNKNQN